MNKNQKLLYSFTEYCVQNPEQRFWQALRNWSGIQFILACDDSEVVVDIENDFVKDTFYWRSINGKRDVICDLDGTLCDITERRKFVQGPAKKDWKAFFENISTDKPRQEVINRVNELSKSHNIILVSGRPADHRQITIEWLKKYNVPYQQLLMRKAGDFRDDTIIKKEILDSYLDKENIELVIDDRPRVIAMWRAEGLKVEDVGDGLDF